MGQRKAQMVIINKQTYYNVFIVMCVTFWRSRSYRTPSQQLIIADIG